jgi:hypothetical protein
MMRSSPLYIAMDEDDDEGREPSKYNDEDECGKRPLDERDERCEDANK